MMAGSPENISFSTFDGTTLRGYHYSVQKQNAPVVIVTAGLSFLKEHLIDAFTVRFQEAGIAAIVYDHRSTGGRIMRFSSKRWKTIQMRLLMRLLCPRT